MSYAKGKNFNVVFLPLRYSAGDTYRGSGLVFSAFKKIVKLNMFYLPPFTLLSVMIFLLILLGLSDHKKPENSSSISFTV